ncbi:MAG TPA: DUF4331 domain-containing protein [Acidimicrobiales bacterium]|jgi:hypothetical protein|nr:DUF4331 domain-containing protein [Acidimicrobiales bacterium]
MSSHREAPSIAKDPVADSTDAYAFVTPNSPGTVTIIANYLPAELPAGGPNFYEFGDDVLYEINIDNDRDGLAEITYQFTFTNAITNTTTFLYNTGPILSLDSPNWNRRQTYTVTRVDHRTGASSLVASGLTCPPCFVGRRSTPDYDSLAAAAVHSLPGGVQVFAGQRADAFFVDLGSIFDLGALRPFQSAHAVPIPLPGISNEGVDTLRHSNVHTIAIQVPIGSLTSDGTVPSDPMSAVSVLGIWTAASRQKGSVLDGQGGHTEAGPWVQVSRLGNPLFNEVIVAMDHKDHWNAVTPDQDSQFAQYVAQPELAKLLPVLYPNVFPNLKAYTKDRADLLAILLTGIPAGIVPGFQNSTGSVQADMLRLNVAIPPTSNPNRLGLVGGDAAGFPNGRRLMDDVVTIELRAIAGLTIPLVDPSFTPDAAASAIEDGTFNPTERIQLDAFPFIGPPHSGYRVPA